MPRVYLTNEQREKAADQRYLDQLADGLRIYQAVHRLTAGKLAEYLELNPRTLRKLLNGEPVNLDTVKLRRIMMASGLSKQGGVRSCV